MRRIKILSVRVNITKEWGQVDPYFKSCDILTQHFLRKKKAHSRTYLAFQRPQWNPNATETKRRCPSFAKLALPSFPRDLWISKQQTHVRIAYLFFNKVLISERNNDNIVFCFCVHCCCTLNTERSYKRQGHALLKHFVGFLCNGGKSE